ASQAIAVGDRDRPMAECRRGQHQFVRMRSTAQKREIGGDLQLRVINGCHCEATLGAEAISTGLLRCARNDGVDGHCSPASTCHKVGSSTDTQREGDRPWVRLARSVWISRSAFFRFMGWMALAGWCFGGSCGAAKC